MKFYDDVLDCFVYFSKGVTHVYKYFTSMLFPSNVSLTS